MAENVTCTFFVNVHKRGDINATSYLIGCRKSGNIYMEQPIAEAMQFYRALKPRDFNYSGTRLTAHRITSLLG